MRPMSIGCLSCHTAVLESREVASSLAVSSSFASPATCPGGVYPQADHEGGLRGRIVNGLGELDPFPLQFRLSLSIAALRS